MVLTVRNGLLNLALGLLAVFVVGYASLLFVLVANEGWTASVGRGNLLQLALQTVVAPVGSLAAYWLARRAYRKSGAPEAFFFALFAASLSGESLLLIQGWLQAGSPAYFSALLTRAIWAFRLTGLFLLFCASLFAFDFTFRKYGNLVGISVAAGILVASWLPLRSASRNYAVLLLSDGWGMALVAAVLGFVVVLNFVVGAIRSPSAERTAQAGAVGCFLAGWAAACLWSPWGIALVVLGAFLAFWKAEQTLLIV